MPDATPDASESVTGGTVTGSDTLTTDAPSPVATASEQPTTDSMKPAPSSPGTEVAVPEALGFVAPLVNGGEIDLAGFAGQPVLFWFWAPG